MTQLRDYQKECLRTIHRRYRGGMRRLLVSLPTGTGKTVIFAQFPRFFQMKRRMLVLAHREELLDQARDKMVRADARLKVEIEQAQRQASPDADVVVASVATLGRSGSSSRLKRLDPEEFYLIVVDEAHHAVAPTYRRILEHFGVFEDSTPKLLVGFTATPRRGDGRGLDKVFQEIAYARGLPEMIQAGHLAPVTGYRVETEVDLSRVRTRMGDFVQSQLSEAVNVSERNSLIVKVFLDNLAERRTLVFCVDVNHAVSLAAGFRRAGIAAEAVTGASSTDERSSVLRRFGSGETRVVTNCMVLTEGYDEPSVAGIILARPTKSGLLYTQMIGRGTRLHPGKENVTVIDIVDVTRQHKLVTLPSLFGLSPDFDLKGRTTDEVERAMRWVRRNRPWVDTGMVRNLDELRYKCTRVDLLELRLPPELAGTARYAWTSVAQKVYRLGLGKGESLTVERNLLGAWEATLSGPSAEQRLGTAHAPDQAVKLAEEFVRSRRPDVQALVSLNARWRRARASEKQISFIRGKGLTAPPGITKGQASHLIAMLTKTRRGEERAELP